LDSKENANENQQAQLFFLLHVSKSKWDFITTFFNKINKLQLISDSFLYKNEYNTLFDHLINNKYVKKIICKVVKDLSGKEITSDFNFCQVAYFDSNIFGLNGFAGMDKIYISYSNQEKLYILLGKYFKCEELVILKCNFVRLFLHVMTDVILRRHLNDFNLSSPKISEENIDETQSFSYDKAIKDGLVAEKELFNAVIDWERSALSSKLNVAYCSSFMNSLLKEEEVSFNIELSGVVLNESEPTIMAADYNFDTYVIPVYE
jgi:hypothetical protein